MAGFNKTDPGKALKVKVINRKTRKRDKDKEFSINANNKTVRSDARKSHLDDKLREDVKKAGDKVPGFRARGLGSVENAVTAVRRRARILKGSKK